VLGRIGIYIEHLNCFTGLFLSHNEAKQEFKLLPFWCQQMLSQPASRPVDFLDGPCFGILSLLPMYHRDKHDTILQLDTTFGIFGEELLSVFGEIVQSQSLLGVSLPR
jgi:hypothetical protein